MMNVHMIEFDNDIVVLFCKYIVYLLKHNCFGYAINVQTFQNIQLLLCEWQRLNGGMLSKHPNIFILVYMGVRG